MVDLRYVDGRIEWNKNKKKSENKNKMSLRDDIMKVLVTGGAGFIGSHIVDSLVERGYDVVVVDNLVTGKKKNVNPEANFYKLDITSPKLIEIFVREQPDFVFHQAAQVNVRSSMKDPLYDAKINIIGSLNVLECCKKFKIKKIIYASSGGAVYGEPEYLPCDEKHPVKPISNYGVSKHVVEHYCYLYSMLYGVKFVSLRYSNVYGPRQDPMGEAGVISIFIDRLLKGKRPIINGDGKQTRDFVFIEDVVNANLLALEKDIETNFPVFNISCNRELSINRLYQILRKLLNSDIDVVHGPEIKGEVKRIYLDNSLAKKILGWRPKYDIEKGLKKTIGFFKTEPI